MRRPGEALAVGGRGRVRDEDVVGREREVEDPQTAMDPPGEGGWKRGRKRRGESDGETGMDSMEREDASAERWKVGREQQQVSRPAE